MSPVSAGVGSARAVGSGLWATVAAESDSNVVLSPFSIAVALGIALAGAEGQTRAEMEDVIGGDGHGLGDLARALEQDGDGDVVLDAANALFAQAGLAWQQPFLDALTDDFDAEPSMVDFAETGATRSAINAWTAGWTRDRIPEILPEGILDAESRLVLVNAVYFKAPWREPFWDRSTANADFHLADGSTVQVPTMRFGVARDDGVR